MKNKKRIVWLLICTLIFSSLPVLAVDSTDAKKISTTAKSYVLMEASSGKVLLENNKDEVLEPASITKVMTMLLINEAIAAGKINWDDTVTISEHAAHMGGSQVFMEPGEEQKVRDLFKCIAIASANDAAVAMAEYIGGSEENFVAMMNKRAAELGMMHTTFKNACGLHEEGHTSTAYDIALMSKELINKFPDISKTCTVWMDNIVHKTRKGESEFGLTNTNKMLKWYSGLTGLKTGYTPEAKHCVSATATRDNMNLIAVVMASQDGKIRFREAGSLLDYGFANYMVKKGPQVGEVLGQVPINKGNKPYVELTIENSIAFVVPKDKGNSALAYEIKCDENKYAPIYKGQKLGEITYLLEGTPVGEADLIAAYDVGKAQFKEMFPYMFKRYFSF